MIALNRKIYKKPRSKSMHFLKRMLTLLIYFGYNSAIRQAKHSIQRKEVSC